MAIHSLSKITFLSSSPLFLLYHFMVSEPGGALLVPHESRENVSIGGYEIGQGTVLLVNAYHIHRDPSLWDEPTKFRPERFEGTNTELLKRMIAFGMGRRRCPGEGLAIREVGLILGSWRGTGRLNGRFGLNPFKGCTVGSHVSAETCHDEVPLCLVNFDQLTRLIRELFMKAVYWAFITYCDIMKS